MCSEMKDFFSTLIHQQLDLMGVTFCEILNEINTELLHRTVCTVQYTLKMKFKWAVGRLSKILASVSWGMVIMRCNLSFQKQFHHMSGRLSFYQQKIDRQVLFWLILRHRDPRIGRKF